MNIRNVFALLVSSAIATQAVPVTFQVNMEVQATIGVFNPSSHTVEIHGSFDGWGPGVTLTATPTNAAVYETTIDIPASAGSTVQYKYVINQSGTLVWEKDGLGPGGAQNRAVTVPESAQTVPVVYFNNESSAPGEVAVTFRVNMGVQAELGNFDPITHTVEARGAFDNWGPGITLSPNPDDPTIYEGTANVTGAGGATYEYKYIINRSGTLEYEGNVGPGAFGNRTFVLSAPPRQTLPLVYFNNVTNNPGAGIEVTFQANMVAQYVRGLFNPDTSVVDVRGPFNNWGNPPYVLTNTPGNPYLFRGTITISNASPGNTIAYKFNMNGAWENGSDRTFVLAGPAQTLPARYFDDVGHLGPLAISAGPSPDELVISWTAYPYARLQYTTDLTSTVWEDVPDTQGQGSATFYRTDADAMFFRVTGP